MISTSFCRFVERRKDNYRVSINNRIVEVAWWMALKPVGSILLHLDLSNFPNLARGRMVLLLSF